MSSVTLYLFSYVYILIAKGKEVKKHIYKKSPLAMCELQLLLFSFTSMESEAYSD